MDPGHDDAVALLLALARPELEALAVTCCAGNASLERTAHNARVVLEVAGRPDIPVAAGLPGPLLRPLETAPEVHGESGLDGPELPEPSFGLVAEHAVPLLGRLVRESAEPVTLIPTGPLTNVAAALRLYPEMSSNVERIVLMGGAVAEGNVTPSAEFNIWVDPEAARVVFESGLPITMVGLDVTHQALMLPDDVARIRDLGGRVGPFVAELLDFFGRFHRERYGWEGAPLHDACAVAEALEPGIVESRPMNVQVETRSELTRGRTVCDVWGVTGLPANAAVGTGLDRERFVAMLVDALSAYS
jgi:pyrimidine-specific ribonucleoside hydrolase